MGFFKNIFGNNKNESISSHEEFWEWFKIHEKIFSNIVKNQGDIEGGFFDKVSPKLNQLNEGFLLLTGMCDENTAEMVITVEGVVKNIVFAEEFIQSAPNIDGWRFTALKPAIAIAGMGIEMQGYRFNKDTIGFYTNNNPEHPDEIDLTFVNQDLNEENAELIINGTYIFLDNYLGELNFVTTIDHMNVVGNESIEKELIPIEKLKDYLIWREKEFLEKYEGDFHSTEESNYGSFQGTLDNGNPLLAIINNDLIQWDRKASHPWIIVIEIPYDGKDNNGMPNSADYELLNEIEDDIMARLKDVDGYLNVGRQTADSIREIYFACKEFRKPSKVLREIRLKYNKRLDVNYDIYKDKYWQTFDRFSLNV